MCLSHRYTHVVTATHTLLQLHTDTHALLQLHTATYTLSQLHTLLCVAGEQVGSYVNVLVKLDAQAAHK